MSWLSYLYPQTIARFSSGYNHDIRVVIEAGQYKLLVNGSRQSGIYIEKLWRLAFSAFNFIPGKSFKKILILGVAGGTVIKLLRQFYPLAKLVGVDIDQTMLLIGKKYFGLEQFSRLKLVEADARLFMKQNFPRENYDLIVVDLFFGRDIPSFVSSWEFLLNLKQFSDGFVIINFLREKEYGKKAEKFYRTLKKVFARVTDYERDNNRFFCCQKQPHSMIK